MPPASIGPYTVESELGRGGMGIVYLAHDTRLDRRVAIKSLPPGLADDQERLGRLRREARMLASLNHPNIAAIHGLEEWEGRIHLVLEYVEGQTLAARMKRGKLPVPEALALARQIAEALEAAHEKGIIHRDLKPGNVMVTTDGAVKVLDFGLARTAEGAPSSTNAAPMSDSPTLSSPAPLHSPTIPGVIMGTAGYMSPEQARGKPVDKRSDIFSFGCVLYEMLAGAGPFPGETATDALGAILHREPDWTLLPPDTPARIRELLADCLAKDRKNRLHDIGDARLEIEKVIADPRGAALGASGSFAPRPWWRSPGVLLAASLLASAAIVVALVFRSTVGTPTAPRSDGQVVRATLDLPKGAVLQTGDRSLAVSPDGTRVVVAAFPVEGAPESALYLRDLARLEFRTLAGADGATYPFWSPDGSSIAFFADKKLKRLDLADGIVRVICEAPAGRGGSWGVKGTIVLAASAIGGLSIVSASGGTPAPITVPDSSDEGHRGPQFLPDGLRFLYFKKHGVYAFDPGTGESRLIMPTEAGAAFVEPGLLVFARDENLMVQPFDPQRLELTGDARPIAAGVQYNIVRDFVNFGISARGTLVYQPVIRAPKSRLAWMDRKGERTPINTEPLPIWNASLSSDARRAAVAVRSDHHERSVVILDLERGTRTPIGDPKALMAFQLWMPGAQSLLCVCWHEGRWCIASFAIAGGQPSILVSEPGFEYHLGSVTPDGRTLIYSQWHNRDKIGELMTLDLGQDQAPKAFMATPDNEMRPRLSPAGDAIAYGVMSPDRSAGLLHVVAFPSPSAPVQVSPTQIDEEYGWLGPGAVYWVDKTRRMWSATITAKDGQLDASLPAEHPLDKNTKVLAYDPARERFLIAIEDEPQEEPQLIVVSDWRPDSMRAQPKPE